MENEKIMVYSLNKLAYLKMLGAEYTLHNRNKTLFYGMLEDTEHNRELERIYHADVEIKKFLSNFGQLRNEIKEIRN